MAAAIKNLPANAEDIKRWGFHPWVRKIPWRRARQPTPGESRGQRSLVGLQSMGSQSWTRLKWLSMHILAWLSTCWHPPKNSDRENRKSLKLLHDLRPFPVHHRVKQNTAQPTQQPDGDDLFHHVPSFLMAGWYSSSSVGLVRDGTRGSYEIWMPTQSHFIWDNHDLGCSTRGPTAHYIWWEGVFQMSLWNRHTEQMGGCHGRGQQGRIGGGGWG